MILKGCQRAYGGELATHLLNAFDNETVELADLRGTVADDLHGAFAEVEATALGTRCEEPLYSLSVNPPFAIDRAVYFAAIDRIEKALKLEGQPRAVVFHVKDGREHCHVVWSRIYADGERLKAVHMGHDHTKLCTLSCALFRELGVPLPDGLAAWEARQPGRHERAGRDYSLAEKKQSDATGVTVAERRAAITEAFRGSDSAEAFRAALALRGYTLAIGDKRGFVVLDGNGEIFSLARQVEGAKAKDIRAKLAALAGVPDVQKAKAVLKERAQARADVERGHVNAVINRERQELQKRQQHRALVQFIIRLKHERHEAEERLALKAKHKAEADEVHARRMRPIRRILERVPGLGALMRYYQAQTDLSLFERQKRERESLRSRHHLRSILMDRADTFRERIERREALSLGRRELCREMRKTMIQHRQALAEGRVSASFGMDRKPADMSPLEWIARSQRREADDAERRRRIDRNQARLLRGNAGHVEALKDSSDLIAEHNPTVRAFRQNAADFLPQYDDARDMIDPAVPDSIGPATGSAAAIMASLQEGDAAASPPDPLPDRPTKPNFR